MERIPTRILLTTDILLGFLHIYFFFPILFSYFGVERMNDVIFPLNYEDTKLEGEEQKN